jgi:ABC-type Zn uptake system ZnuABC Zn-binding protein ZnuA
VPIDRMLTERRIQELLDAAESKHRGAEFAEELEERDAAQQLREERDAKIAEAHRLDPRHVSVRWDKTVLPTPLLPVVAPTDGHS